MKFWVKSQDVDQTTHIERMVNVCDEKLLGKSLTKDAKISEYFYKGKLASMEEMLKEIYKGTLINLIGNGCVKIAVDAKLVEKMNIRQIGKQNHAIIMISQR